MKVKLSKIDRWVISLVAMDVKKLTWLFFGIFISEQILSYSLEVAIAGNGFFHWFDLIFSWLLIVTYFHYLSVLGDLLLGILSGDTPIHVSKILGDK
ncbi:hypothetical protein [Shewanella sp. HL-SH2]|uniref:hypothetical protein n=1 Tax=Shewanella sp. HL-SH2 TaxID=3436238 RepID=UPI003EBB7291